MPPTSLANADNLNLLIPDELQLCSTLNIFPKPYLTVKETLLRENSRRGGLLAREDAKKLIDIDPYKVEKIYNYLRSAGILFRQPRRRQSAEQAAPDIEKMT